MPAGLELIWAASERERVDVDRRVRRECAPRTHTERLDSGTTCGTGGDCDPELAGNCGRQNRRSLHHGIRNSAECEMLEAVKVVPLGKPDPEDLFFKLIHKH